MLDLSLKTLVASPSPADRDVLRRGAARATIPVEMREAGNATEATALAAGADVVLLEPLMAGCAEVLVALRSLAQGPLLVLLAAPGEHLEPLEADGVAAKPADVDAAAALLEGYARLKMPARALVVDDSATMRSIVRKILAASRFRLEIAEADDGAAALQQVGARRFEIVFLDYNMPGLDGLQTLSEIRRLHPEVAVVIMSSLRDERVAAQARVEGAAAFLGKPFYPADVNSVLNRVYARRVMDTRLI